jgi:hypothetical protein
LPISKQKLCQAEVILLLRIKRESSTQNVGFVNRPFLFFVLPIKQPPTV